MAHTGTWHQYNIDENYRSPEYPRQSELLEENRHKIKVFTAEEPWFISDIDLYASVAEKLYFMNITEKQIITKIPSSVHTIILNDANITFQPQTKDQFDHIRKIVLKNSPLHIFTVFDKLINVIITYTTISTPFKCKTFSIHFQNATLSENALTQLEAKNVELFFCEYPDEFIPVIVAPVESLDILSSDLAISLNKLPKTLLQILVDYPDNKSKVELSNMVLIARHQKKPFRVFFDTWELETFLKDEVTRNRQSALVDKIKLPQNKIYTENIWKNNPLLMQ
jgi:hypothetical protein